MNPNSEHQLWSKWIWYVKPEKFNARSFVEVKDKFTYFAAKSFGLATTMQITEHNKGYVIKILTEGHSVNDPAYVAHIERSWQRMFETGFGPGTWSKLITKFMAGHRDDGLPAEQMIVLPAIACPSL